MQTLRLGKNATVSITDKEAESIKIYLDQIKKIPLLTEEELYDLCKRKDAGDKEARDKIVRANLRFVVSVAKHYQYMGLSFEDLIDEGNVGLIKAVDKFDITKGFTVTSHAVHYIKGTILAAINDSGRMVTFPANQKAASDKIKKATIKVLQQTHYEPTIEQLQEYMKKNNINNRDNLGFTIKDLKCLQKLGYGTTHESIDTPLATHGHSGTDKESTVTKGDLLTEGNEGIDTVVDYERSEKKYFAEALLHTLDEKARDILKNEFEIGDYMTVEQILEKYNLTSPERLRQIREKTIKNFQKLIPLGRGGEPRVRYSYIGDPKAFLNGTPVSDEIHKEWEKNTKIPKTQEDYRRVPENLPPILFGEGDLEIA